MPIEKQLIKLDALGLENDMDKTTLLNTIQIAYAQLESLVASLSEAQLCTPALEDGWSIKDIMAHTAAWEQICARWLDEVLHGITPQPAERVTPGINDRIYREHRDRSLTDVRTFFHQAHQQFLQQVNLLVQTLSEEELNASQHFAWTEAWPGATLLAVIADNSYEHYQDHTQQIRSGLDILNNHTHTS